MYKIVFYKGKNGKNEVVKYIKSLRRQNNKDARMNLNKIVSYINQLSKHGLLLGEPYIKHLEDNIWELRPLKNRILFANYCDNKFIILSIFIKKTRKTPQREIEKAKKYLKNYIDWSEEK